MKFNMLISLCFTFQIIWSQETSLCIGNYTMEEISALKVYHYFADFNFDAKKDIAVHKDNLGYYGADRFCIYLNNNDVYDYSKVYTEVASNGGTLEVDTINRHISTFRKLYNGQYQTLNYIIRDNTPVLYVTIEFDYHYAPYIVKRRSYISYFSEDTTELFLNVNLKKESIHFTFDLLEGGKVVVFGKEYLDFAVLDEFKDHELGHKVSYMYPPFSDAALATVNAENIRGRNRYLDKANPFVYKVIRDKHVLIAGDVQLVLEKDRIYLKKGDKIVEGVFSSIQGDFNTITAFFG